MNHLRTARRGSQRSATTTARASRGTSSWIGRARRYGRARTPFRAGDGIAKSTFGGRGATRPTTICYNRGMDNNTANDPLPSRKKMDHRGPLSIVVSDAIYFITIAAAERGGTEMTNHAAAILESARHYQQTGKWFLYILLIMPDHIHMLVHISTETTLSGGVANWKHYLVHTVGIRFQRDFFDTRIRDQAHFAEKWNYICKNPVAKGLVARAKDWPHSIAFDRSTGKERPHR